MIKSINVIENYPETVLYNQYESRVGGIILNNEYDHYFHVGYSDVETLPKIISDAKTIISDITDDSIQELKQLENGHIAICHNTNSSSYDLYGYFHSSEEAKKIYNELIKYKPIKKVKEDQTPIHFWHLSKDAKRNVKQIHTPFWNEIMQNYPISMQEDLTALMNLTPDNLSGGKLILWRGLPGTGKTWCIRSLTNSWKKWCTAHYIIDLDNFLGTSVNYMLGVIAKINNENELDADSSVDDVIDYVKEEAAGKKFNKWNLLILEDAGELITNDAKLRAGTALSKLLNIGDGLLGQGMNLLILITTNEELQDIHSAISRQGRCLSNLEFISFNETEAKEWLKNHNYEGDLPPSTTLSDLYSVLPNKMKTIKNKTVTKKRMGFM